MKKVLALFVALFSMLLVSPAGAQDATIMLAHGIPDTDVDVVVDGDIVIPNYSFGSMEDLSAFAGQTLPNLTVNLTGADTVALDLGDCAVPPPATTPWSRTSMPTVTRRRQCSRTTRPRSPPVKDVSLFVTPLLPPKSTSSPTGRRPSPACRTELRARLTWLLAPSPPRWSPLAQPSRL